MKTIDIELKKICKLCKIERTIPFFRIVKVDGKIYTRVVCRSCEYEYYKNYREQNRDKVRQAMRDYWKTPNGKKLRLKSTAKYRKKYPERYKAYKAVSNALMRNTITRKPCYACGNKKSQAHHEDYSKQLDIIWLCGPCHRAYHSKIDKFTSPLDKGGENEQNKKPT